MQNMINGTRDQFGTMRAAIDRKGEIFVASKTFSDYLGGNWISNFVSVVHPDDQEPFKNQIKCIIDGTESGMYKIKHYDDEYRLNLITMRCNSFTSNDGYDLELEMFDIEGLIEDNKRLVSEKNQMKRLFGLTDDYIFVYDKNTEQIQINYYRNDGNNEIHTMPLPQWERYMLENHYIHETEKADLNQIVYYLRNYNADFSVKIKSSLRTNGKLVEMLQFIGVLYTDDMNNVIIGRIVPAGSTNKIRSVRILDELKYDGLTNVLNKTAITDSAKWMIEQYETGKNPVTIAIIDIDRFKEINDTYGHLYGDKVIAKFAAKIREVVGDDGYVGRIGGDEFMIVTDSVHDVPSLRALLRSVRTQIKWEFSKDKEGPQITCSIGAARLPDNGKEYEELFRKADFCLYIAKEKGRDRYVFFRDDLHRGFFQDFINNKLENRGGKGREIQELKFIMNYMQQAGHMAGQAFELAAIHIMKEFKIDSINVYAGESLVNVFHVGTELKSNDDAMYAKTDRFRTFLNGANYVQIGFVGNLYDEYPELYEILKNRRVFSTIQCIVGDVANPIGVVTFDKCNEAAQWAEYEVCVAVILACTAEKFLKDKI